MTVHGQHYWATRFSADAAQLEQRRQASLKQVHAAAAALRQTWPEIEAIGLAETSGPLPVDLKRREDFSNDLAERLLRRSQTL